MRTIKKGRKYLLKQTNGSTENVVVVNPNMSTGMGSAILVKVISNDRQLAVRSGELHDINFTDTKFAKFVGAIIMIVIGAALTLVTQHYLGIFLTNPCPPTAPQTTSPNS